MDVLKDQPVDYDLDEFRNFPFDYNTNHICRWYFHMYGITADLGKPWREHDNGRTANTEFAHMALLLGIGIGWWLTQQPLPGPVRHWLEAEAAVMAEAPTGRRVAEAAA